MNAKITGSIAGLALLASVAPAMPATAAGSKLPAGARPPHATALIAFTHNGQVYLMPENGGARQLVGTAGWYAWSYDGRSLLLVRGGDLLLLEPAGAVLRTLATHASEEDFPPAWAIGGASILFMRLDLGANKATTLLIGAGEPQGQP